MLVDTDGLSGDLSGVESQLVWHSQTTHTVWLFWYLQKQSAEKLLTYFSGWNHILIMTLTDGISVFLALFFPPLHTSASVFDNSSMCWCSWSWGEPAGSGSIRGVLVLLPQGHRWRHQKAWYLLCYLGCRHHRSHHMVSQNELRTTALLLLNM